MLDARAVPGEVLALLAAVAFAGKAIVVKLALATGADPIALLFARMAFAAPVFVFLAWRNAPGRPTARQAAALFALGLLGYHVSAALDFAGLRYVSAGLERVVLYVHPTLVVLLSAAFLGRRIALAELGGIGVAWLGLAVAVAADIQLGAPGDVVRGVSLILGCAATYAAYLMGADALGQRLGAVYTASVATAASALTLGVQVSVTHADAVRALSAPALGWAAVLALVNTVLPVALLAVAIRRIGAARASALGMVGPTVAALLGWAILGEPLSALQLAGGLIVVAGVWLSRRSAPPSRAVSAPARPAGAA